jgi:hypothetical protein
MNFGTARLRRRMELEPGRALANAQHPPAKVKAGLAEQLAYIRAAQPALTGESR